MVWQIDLSNDPRRAQFDYFRNFRDPYVSVTVPVDITRLRERGTPLFLSYLWCAIRAANAVPELRRRIDGDRVVEYDRCLSSHTVALPNGSYCYCTLDCEKPFDEFLPYAQAETERAKRTASLTDGADAAQLFFVTALPWLPFASLSLPVPEPPDSNVRISFGGITEQNGRSLLPVNLTAHHALADGIHLSRFFAAMQERIADF